MDRSIGGPRPSLQAMGEIVGVVTGGGFFHHGHARGGSLCFPIRAALLSSWTASAYTMNSGSGSSQGLHHAEQTGHFQPHPGL